MESATRELMWLNSREENEISRDWSAKGLAIEQIERYHQVGDGMMEYHKITSIKALIKP